MNTTHFHYKKFICSALLLAFLHLFSSNASAIGILDQQFGCRLGGLFVCSTGAQLGPSPFKRAQTFTVGMDGRLTQFILTLGRNSAMTQTLTAEIQTLTATGLPSGTVLGSTTIPATNFPATSMREPVAFDFSSQNIPVQIGDQLAIVLTYDTISVDLSRPSWTGEVGFAATYAGGEALSNIFGPWGPLFSSSASDLEFQSFVLDIPPGIPGGNGTLFIIDAVEILGVGAEATNLGGIHKLAVDSFGGIGLQQDSNTIKTTFTFDAEGAPAGPVDAFVYGLLEGSLLADLGGTAGVTASLSLFDLGLNLLGSDSFLLNIAANLSELSTADIFETLGFGVQLIPGQQYILQGDLSVRANGVSQFGRGTALFNSTFEYTLSGLTENPFTAVPEPATFLLMGLGLVGLGFARRRRLNA